MSAVAPRYRLDGARAKGWEEYEAAMNKIGNRDADIAGDRANVLACRRRLRDHRAALATRDASFRELNDRLEDAFFDLRQACAHDPVPVEIASDYHTALLVWNAAVEPDRYVKKVRADIQSLRRAIQYVPRQRKRAKGGE
jgi:hypothetical protein